MRHTRRVTLRGRGQPSPDLVPVLGKRGLGAITAQRATGSRATPVFGSRKHLDLGCCLFSETEQSSV